MSVAVPSDEVIEKAERLLTSQRVKVPDAKVMFVRGDTGDYIVVCTPGGEWLCSCPAYGSNCSHLVAVSFITGNWEPKL
jgi:hypothetical protein